MGSCVKPILGLLTSDDNEGNNIPLHPTTKEGGAVRQKLLRAYRQRYPDVKRIRLGAAGDSEAAR